MPPVKKHRPLPTCSVCGLRLAAPRECKCPWDRLFQDWPESLQDRVNDLVAGGPFPGS